jgi:hypothetical protein
VRDLVRQGWAIEDAARLSGMTEEEVARIVAKKL